MGFLFLATVLIAAAFKSGFFYIPQEGITPLLKGRLINDFFDSMTESKLPFRVTRFPLFFRPGPVLDRQIEIDVQVLDLEIGEGWFPTSGTDAENLALHKKERSRADFKIRISADLVTSNRPAFVVFLKKYFFKNTRIDDEVEVVQKTTEEALTEELSANVAAILKAKMSQVSTSFAEQQSEIDETTLNAKLMSLGILVTVTQFTIRDMNPTEADKLRRQSEDALTIAKNEAAADKERAIGLKAKSEAEAAGDIAKKKQGYEDKAAFVERVAAVSPEAAKFAPLADANTVAFGNNIVANGD
jgi:hypothetical protein